MKPKYVATLVLLILASRPTKAALLGTSFTYQGRLTDSGAPANGSYDLRFRLFNAPDGGGIVGSPKTNSPVVVSNGLFTVNLDFGAGIFDGSAHWLEIAARTNGSPGDFTPLNPLQPITPSPYAIFALNTVASLYNTASGSYASVAGGLNNQATSFAATVGGGRDNTASADFAVVAGGAGNVASNLYAAVGGGWLNIAGGYAATVPGGYESVAAGDYSFAAGRRAKAHHAGTFVWADSNNADFASTQNNQFLIRASGGVGIGTAAPGSALSVAGDGDIAGNMGIGMLPLYGLDINRQLVVHDNTIAFRRANAHRWILQELPNRGLEVFQVYNDADNVVARVRFAVADDGNIGVGVTDPAFLLDVGGRARVREGGGLPAGIWFQSAQPFGANGMADIGFVGVLDPTRIGFYGNDPRGGPGWGLTFDTFTGNVGIGTGTVYPTYKLQVNGSVAGVGAYNNISDARYKTNIVPVSGALETVRRLKGVRFDWRDKDFPSMNFEGGPQLGFIAQEVKEALPEAVSADAEGIHCIAYTKIIPVLVEAIKEQQTQIESLCATDTVDVSAPTLATAIERLNHKMEEQLKAKDARIAELETRLAALERLFTAKAND